MNMLGLCYLCGRPAFRECSMCHRPTCSNHLKENGMCAKCYEAYLGRDVERISRRFS